MLTFKTLPIAFACLLANASQGAGFEPIEIPARGEMPAIKAIAWTPCSKQPEPIPLGPFTIRATRNCKVEGSALPLVVISHGNGGNRLGHHDTAIALADAGIVAVSFDHPGNSFGDNAREQDPGVFTSRPADARRVITHMLTKWDGREALAKTAVGVFGFSRGGYTALALAGAKPSGEAGKARFCSNFFSLFSPLCWNLRLGSAPLEAEGDVRIKAAVVVDPLNLFDAAGLSRVKIPIQLWASEYGGDGVDPQHVELIRTALQSPPEFHVAKGAGHFAFLAPCPEALARGAPEICLDRDGFDRAAFHRGMNAAVVAFLKRELARAP